MPNTTLHTAPPTRLAGEQGALEKQRGQRYLPAGLRVALSRFKSERTGVAREAWASMFQKNDHECYLLPLQGNQVSNLGLRD